MNKLQCEFKKSSVDLQLLNQFLGLEFMDNVANGKGFRIRQPLPDTSHKNAYDKLSQQIEAK